MVSDAIIQAVNTAKNHPHIMRVGVFGSRARNEETVGSDIDILIDYNTVTDDFLDDIGGFMEDMERLIHGRIDYITVPGLMKSSDEALRLSVLDDVVWIYRANSVKQNT